MSVFLDEPNKRVILSARKCGLMTLSFSVTAVYKNKSENKGWYHGNPDPHYVQGKHFLSKLIASLYLAHKIIAFRSGL